MLKRLSVLSNAKLWGGGSRLGLGVWAPESWLGSPNFLKFILVMK